MTQSPNIKRESGGSRTNNEVAKVPEVLPLHPKANGILYDIRISDLDSTFKLCEKEISETLEQLLEIVPDYQTLNPLIKNISDAFSILQKEKSEYKKVRSALKDAKREYVDRYREHPQVTLDTWDHYSQNESDFRGLYATLEEHVKNNQTDANDLSDVDPKERILRVLPYIWNDPRCVLPDDILDGHTTAENNREQDLQIEGGQIELICPITCKPFEEPLISKKCHHTFDKAGITSYLAGGTDGKRDCPQAGCNQVLSIQDFEPDPVMTLRCKIAKIQQGEKDEYEGLDVL